LFLKGTFLAVQWLRLNASNAGDTGSISCWGTKMLYAILAGSKKKLRKKKIHLKYKSSGRLKVTGWKK